MQNKERYWRNFLSKQQQKWLLRWEFLFEGKSEWDKTASVAGKTSDYQITNVTECKFTASSRQQTEIYGTNQSNKSLCVTDVVTQITDCVLSVLLFACANVLTNMCRHAHKYSHRHLCTSQLRRLIVYFIFRLAMLFTYLIVVLLSTSEMTNRSISIRWKWNYYAAATPRSVFKSWNLLCNCLG